MSDDAEVHRGAPAGRQEMQKRNAGGTPMSDYTPPPELCEAAQGRFLHPAVKGALQRAVAFRHPDGHPELVPYDVHQAVVSDAIDTALAAYDQRVREGGLVPWELHEQIVTEAVDKAVAGAEELFRKHELVPWEQVRELVEAAGDALAYVNTWGSITIARGAEGVRERRDGCSSRLRAALAKFKENPDA